MEISYQKLGKDHPMYGKVDFVVTDGNQPLCYKTSTGYLPLENSKSSGVVSNSIQSDVKTKELYVLSFKINGESEEMTFFSKPILDKTKEELESKGYVTDFKITPYSVLI